MQDRLSKNFSIVSLIVSVTALIVSVTVVANAARQREVVFVGQAASRHAAHTGSSHGKGKKKTPAPANTTVALSRNAQKLDGYTAEQVAGTCPPDTVDLGTWCLETNPYPLNNSEIGQNDYVFASKKCVEQGGYLPSAAQLLGAAARVKLEGTINDSPLTATIDQDPERGLKDQREMTATLVTTQAGPEAAGSEGITEGATGNPQTGEPDPVPVPAVPEPETLQYVTVYSNKTKGGFAGSEPVAEPQNFRCAYNKALGALEHEEG
jgi:hypothetical protein